jgi:ubiquitin-protein ligase
MPSKNHSLLWDGIIFVRVGPLKNGIFRFTLQLDSGFPLQKSPPVIKMLSPLSHPLISLDTLVFDSSSAFPVWSENDHVYEILKFFKYSLENIDYCCTQIQRHSNSSAVEMITNDRQKYLDLAKESVTKSVNEIFTSNVNDDANHVFSFDKTIVDEGLHDQIIENMKSLSDTCDNFSFSFERRG